MGLIDRDGYAVETDGGLMWVRPLDRLLAEEKALRAVGVDNICPRCNGHCAIMLGNPDGDHWCIACQVREEAEGLINQSE